MASRKKRAPVKRARKRTSARPNSELKKRVKKRRVLARKKLPAKKREQKRASKRAPKKPLISRKKRASKKRVVKPAGPIRQYREPVKQAKLVGLTERDANYLVASGQKIFAYQLQEKLRLVRKFFGGFEARDGYPLTAHGIVRMHPSRYQRLLYHHEQVARATSVPYVTFTPANAVQRKAAIERAGELAPNQRVFIIHHLDAKTARARYVPDDSGGDTYGTIEIVTRAGAGEVFERIYYFPKRPKSWRGVRKQTELLMKLGMRTGFYKIFNTIYGPLGEPSEREQLLDTLDLFWSTYNKWLAGTLLGWVWIGTSLDTALARQDRQRSVAEKFQEAREAKQKREQKRMRTRLGIKAPKRGRPKKVKKPRKN